jgi:hypothetical protein
MEQALGGCAPMRNFYAAVTALYVLAVIAQSLRLV